MVNKLAICFVDLPSPTSCRTCRSLDVRGSSGGDKKYDQAIPALETAVNLADRSTETLAALGLAYAASGNNNQAQAILADLEKPVGAKRYVMPYNLAKIYSVSGDAEKAFDWLEVAYKEGNPDLIELNSEPVFDPIRSDPRFSDLMRRVGWNI